MGRMKPILIVAAAGLFFALPALALAQGLEYTPLEPLSPGVQTYPNIGSYLSSAFGALLTLGALFAVVTFTIGGVVYMTTDAVGQKSGAVERMRASLWGLLLLAASVLILQTINPGLLNFDLSSIGERFGRGSPSATNPGQSQQQQETWYCKSNSNGACLSSRTLNANDASAIGNYENECRTGNGVLTRVSC